MSTPSLPGSQVSLRYYAVSAQNGKPAHHLLALSGRKRKFEYPAASGDDSHPGIPQGLYWIYPDEIHELGPLSDYRAKAAFALLAAGQRRNPFSAFHHAEDLLANAWGRYRIPLHQSVQQEQMTHRSNLFIHGGSVYGSAGCIDLAEWIDVFVAHLRGEFPNRENPPVYLRVE